jgi:hypothetical protein
LIQQLRLTLRRFISRILVCPSSRYRAGSPSRGRSALGSQLGLGPIGNSAPVSFCQVRSVFVVGAALSGVEMARFFSSLGSVFKLKSSTLQPTSKNSMNLKSPAWTALVRVALLHSPDFPLNAWARRLDDSAHCSGSRRTARSYVVSKLNSLQPFSLC